MKRKSSQINPEDPSPIRSSLPRGFHGVRSSKTGFSLQNEDVGCPKRVRFTGLDNDTLPEASSVPLEGYQVPRSDEPKTSEFAFFKKLKEGVGQRFHSRLLHHDKSQMKKSKSSDCCRERTDIVENSPKDTRSSLLTESVTPNNFISFLSRHGNASNKSDVKRPGTTLGDIQSLRKNVKEYGTHFRPGGAERRHANIFSTKRQKLHQWVADTSFPEIDELCSSGYDFVSALLSRLFPGRKEETSGHVENATTKSRSLTPPESDVQFKKFHWMATTNLLELECGLSLDVGLSSHSLDIPRKIELSNSCPLTSYASKTYPDNRIMEYDSELGERTNPIWCTEGHSTCGLHIEKYGSLASNNVELLDDFHCRNVSLCGREPNTLLLGWDSDSMTDERNSAFTCQSMDLRMYPISSSLWGDDRQQNSNDGFTASGLFTPLLSYHPPNLPSLQSSPSARYGSHNFGEGFLLVKDDIVRVLSKFSSPLSCTGNHLNLAEYSNHDTAYKGTNMFLSPQNRLWVMSKVLDEEHHLPGVEDLFSSRLDCDLDPVNGSRRDHYLSTHHAVEFPQNKGICSNFPLEDEYENSLDGLGNHISKDMVNIHDCSSFQFQISIDK